MIYKEYMQVVSIEDTTPYLISQTIIKIFRVIPIYTVYSKVELQTTESTEQPSEIVKVRGFYQSKKKTRKKS